MATSKTLADFSSDLPRPAVACTLVRVVGSVPQEVGVRMWVTEDRFFGTLGGGEFERQVLEHARGLLEESGPRPHLKEYVLCKEMGQCCGGRAEVFFEMIPRDKTVHLFGGGHVGRATAEVLSQMPFRVVLVDSRPEWAKPDGLPRDVRPVLQDPLEYARSRTWDPTDAACIFTHSHDLDFLLVRELLPKPLGYLGLIGSEHKARVFQARLQGAGNGGAQTDWEGLWEERMRCPIGLPLRSKNPKVIAVSIAAELLKEWGLGGEGEGGGVEEDSELVGEKS